MKNSRWSFFVLPALAAVHLSAAACAQEPESPQAWAEVNGVAVVESDLDDRGELIQLQQQIYQARLKAVNERIGDILLEKEAERRGMTVKELLEAEVESKVEDPTDEEVDDLYEQQKKRIRRPLEEVRDPLMRAMRNMKEEKQREAFVDSLRAAADVEILLEPPRVEVEVSSQPRRGPADAPVTLVEFSDFQCPYCRRMQPVLMEIFGDYEGKVSWVFKDLPLVSIHSQALRAAEAARCAGDQEKFWEFRDSLFERKRITSETIDEISSDLNLEPEPFQACLESNKYREVVEENSREAQSLGVNGTPTFVVNGIVLSGFQSKSQLTRVIDAELAAVERRGNSQVSN